MAKINCDNANVLLMITMMAITANFLGPSHIQKAVYYFICSPTDANVNTLLLAFYL